MNPSISFAFFLLSGASLSFHSKSRLSSVATSVRLLKAFSEEQVEIGISDLAKRLGGSPYHLQRNFKRLVGVTPREYADACRLKKVKP